MNGTKALLLLILALAGAPGCAHVISREVLNEANLGISFAALLDNPEAYKGETIVVGGVMVEAVNRNDGTMLEVSATRLGARGKPVNPDNPGGRFLAFYEGFLDCDVYRKGRRVTLAGVVTGSESRKLGEADYRYPRVRVREIHLWRVETPRVYYSPYIYPVYPFYGPCYGRSHFHGVFRGF